MEYRDLLEMIKLDPVGHEYFFSLPREVRGGLSLSGESIRSTAELHRQARAAERQYLSEVRLRLHGDE